MTAPKTASQLAEDAAELTAGIARLRPTDVGSVGPGLVAAAHGVAQQLRVVADLEERHAKAKESR